MIKLDDDLLQELGLAALPPEEKKKLLAHIYETLEMRVGMKLAEQMSDAQLTEFEQFIDRNDEAGALKWLETNFPNYKDVVAAEFDRLKTEIRQVAPQILAASSQQSQATGSADPVSAGQQSASAGGSPQPQPLSMNMDNPARTQPGEAPMWPGDQPGSGSSAWQQTPQPPADPWGAPQTPPASDHQQKAQS